MKQPHHYTKRILLAVSGLSPQILTETLYGLSVAMNMPFIPTEIHLITTLEGAHRAKLDLLHQETGKFPAFCKEYQLPAIQFDESHIHVIADQTGTLMDDIRNPEQNEAAADFITRIVSKLTQDPVAALHVSIAGGRKTMGYYLGYALSLFGRDQDRLSHVLVSDGYEGHPDFYYPSKKSRVIYTRDNRPLDTQEAKVSLAEIPFVRLRNDIPENLLKGTAGFLETINLARKAELPSELIIDAPTKKLSANGIIFTLPDILLAFYSWVIKQTIEQQQILYRPHASCRMALAGFLHDVGKFAERAKINVERQMLEDNKQRYCPHHKKYETDKGWFSHVHAAYTGMAVDILEQHAPKLVGGNVYPFGSWKTKNTDDSLINAAAAHHKPDTFLQWIIATADRVASGFEREAFEKKYNQAEEKNHYQSRQLTLFEQIGKADEILPIATNLNP